MMPEGARPGILAMLRGTHMSTTFQPSLIDETFNGWSNYETWNVSLWIANDEGLYEIAREYKTYSALLFTLQEAYGLKQTPDGVKFNDPKINRIEMNEMLQEL
mgnify:FL=1